MDDGEAQSQTPLWMAAYFGHVELVELLVRAGADIEAKAHPSQTTPLYIAGLLLLLFLILFHFILFWLFI